MKPFTDHDCPALATLVAVVARSQIVVAKPARFSPALPAGFDATDIAVLDWIVAEGRRLGHGLVRM